MNEDAKMPGDRFRISRSTSDISDPCRIPDVPTGADLPRVEVSISRLVDRARMLCKRGQRSILGITGPPASGKTTLALEVARHIGSKACVVGMDGFHLANIQLQRLDRLARKGAIDTFDANGFVTILQRLMLERDRVVYAPAFDRVLDTSIAGAIAVEPAVELVITEGNYLLDEDYPWVTIDELLAESWYCELDEQVRIERLIARHMEFGKSQSDAINWIRSSDQLNAKRIAVYRSRADIVVKETALTRS